MKVVRDARIDLDDESVVTRRPTWIAANISRRLDSLKCIRGRCNDANRRAVANHVDSARVVDIKPRNLVVDEGAASFLINRRLDERNRTYELSLTINLSQFVDEVWGRHAARRVCHDEIHIAVAICTHPRNLPARSKLTRIVRSLQ